MKKIFYILKVTIALLLVFGAASCSKSDEGGSSLKLSKTELAFTSSVRTLTLTVTTNQEWTATSPEWLTCSPASGTGNATVTVTAAENPGAERTGTIKIAGGGKEKVINVTQEGVDFSISQYTFEFDSAGTPIKATVISKYAWDIDIPEKASWLEVSPAQSSGGETVADTELQRHFHYVDRKSVHAE